MKPILFVIGFILLCLPASMTKAATLSVVKDPVMGCFATLTGVISNGDAAQVDQLIKARPKDPYAIEPAHGSRVCLNSEGGSLAEGIKLSRLFNERGIGTAIARGHVCLSACALAFMGGNHFTESDIGDLPNRILHPLGRLGFHSPSLQVDAGSYDEATVTKAYDVALKSVSAVLEMAARNRFALSLSVQMLATSASDMFDVTTVGQASRWGIGVGPVVDPAEVTAIAVANACSNLDAQALDQAAMVRAASGVTFERSPDVIWAKMADGFRQEAATGCSASFTPLELREGGLDSVGFVEITDIRPLYVYQMFPPEFLLADLARSDDARPQIASAELSVTRAAVYSGVCVVLSATTIGDNDPCQVSRSESRNALLRDYAKNIFQWPSGAKTVVEALRSPDQQQVKLNGAETQQDMIWDKSFEPIQAALSRVLDMTEAEAHCWLNPASGNRFCFIERTPAANARPFTLSLFDEMIAP
jgi:hypothetical protein